MQLDLADHRKLISTLLQGDIINSTGVQPTLIETHISSVLLTDQYVYKIKKPIDLGFLDFSTLQKRQFYCAEELRLNKRLSPQLYVDVLPLYGTAENPGFEPQGDILEYLVRMKPFPQQAQLDRLLLQGLLSAEQLAAFADYIAQFHQSAVIATERDSAGKPDSVFSPVKLNFSQIQSFADASEYSTELDSLEVWSNQFFNQNQPLFEQRKNSGFIRECHGDLHCRNLAWVDKAPLAFDCIEFDPNLYWIDTINDIAFLLMDLHHQQQQPLAQAFLNRYVEVSGDYQGLKLLRFYMIYRAMVRAKIEIITANQPGIANDEKEQALIRFGQYIKLAETLSIKKTPTIYIMHGFSGSGKSTVSKQLSALESAIVIRSDIERKRMNGIDPLQKGSHNFEQGIYSSEITQRTYQRLAAISRQIIESGYSVIVDATFSQLEQRLLFAELARQFTCKFVIVDLKVSEDVLRQRILNRSNDVSDADIHVLEKQLDLWLPLTEAENSAVIQLRADRTIDDEDLLEIINQHLSNQWAVGSGQWAVNTEN